MGGTTGDFPIVSSYFQQNQILTVKNTDLERNINILTQDFSTPKQECFQWTHHSSSSPPSFVFFSYFLAVSSSVNTSYVATLCQVQGKHFRPCAHEAESSPQVSWKQTSLLTAPLQKSETHWIYLNKIRGWTLVNIFLLKNWNL